MSPRICAVPTCTRYMPSDQPMCLGCWAKVPKSLRTSIDNADPTKKRYDQLVAQAIREAAGIAAGGS